MIVKRGRSKYSVLVENIEKKLGSVVKSLRQAAGMTQEALAQQLTAEGLPTKQNTVAKLEGGLRPTTVTEFGALARIFNYSVPQLAEAVFSAGAEENEALRSALLAEFEELHVQINNLRNELAMRTEMAAATKSELTSREVRAILLETRIVGLGGLPDGLRRGEHPEEA